MPAHLVSTGRRALTGVRIGVLVLGAVLLTSSQVAAQDDDDPTSQGSVGAGTASVTPDGVVIHYPIPIGEQMDPVGAYVLDDNGIVEQSEPVGAVVNDPANGIVEQSEPVGAYLVPDDVLDLDSDGDGLFDRDEINAFFTDPYSWDTDGDGVGDGEEVSLGTDPTA